MTSWVALSLNIGSKSVSAWELEKLLQTEASFKAEVGDRVSKRSPAAGVRDSSLCSFESSLLDSAPLQEHVEWLLRMLQNHEVTLLELASLGCELDVKIGFSSGSGQGGFALGNDVLLLLGRLGIDLYVNLFPPAAEE